MGNALESRLMTAEEFLAWDATQSVKHEFVRGEVFAMAGASERHITVVGNLVVALRRHLRGTPFWALPSGMLLKVERADCFFYPDLLVTCGETTATHQLYKTDARLVVEVLSPSTAGFDLGNKFAAYRLLPSLTEYLAIDADRRRCDLYRKRTDGLWVLHPTGPEEALQLTSVDLTVPPAVLWADLEAAAVDPAPAGP